MIRFLLEGNGAGTLDSIEGFLNMEAFADPEIGIGGVFQACTLVCLCFVGFHALTTYAEETVNPEKTVGKAIILTCLIYGVICIIMAYFSQLSWPTAYNEINDTGTAAAELVEYVMGNTGSIIFSVIYLSAAFAS